MLLLVEKLCWVATLVAAAFAIFLLYMAFNNAATASMTDKAVVAATAAAIALVPYVFTRALQEISR